LRLIPKVFGPNPQAPEAPQLAKVSKQKTYKPFRITSFADSHRLTLLISHLFEKRGEGVGTLPIEFPIWDQGWNHVLAAFST
jgi:hypothetical protein